MDLRLRLAQAQERELLLSPVNEDLEEQAERVRALVALRQEVLELDKQQSEAPATEILGDRPRVTDLLRAGQSGECIPRALHAAHSALDLTAKYEPGPESLDVRVGALVTRLSLG